MPEFCYRNASDATLSRRHFSLRGGALRLDTAGIAICYGIDEAELAARMHPTASGPVITAVDFERGRARVDIVRVLIGREPSLFDVLRCFGDEVTADGLLGAPGGAGG